MEHNGHKVIALNNKPYFMKGVLDQGYYQPGLYTPESYEDYIKDIQLVKSLGFNTIRKHIKIEAPRWYYECDRLGVLVWQDFINGGGEYKFSTIAYPMIQNIVFLLEKIKNIEIFLSKSSSIQLNTYIMFHP